MANDGLIIGQSFDELQKKVRDFTKEVQSSQKEVRAIDQALKLDPSNVELVKQKYDIFADQLKSTKNKAAALKEQIERLNEQKERGELSAEYYAAELERLNQQLRLAEIETSKFTGAIERQNTAVAKAQYGDMTKQMQQAQKAMSNMNTVMSSTTALMGVMGAAGDQSGNKVYQGMQKAMSGMQAVIGLSSMLQSMNNKSALSFQGLATSAMMAVATFTLVDSFLSGLPDEVRPVVGAITALIAVIGVATVAWMAFHGTMSLGVAVPIILASVAAGIAGIKTMIPKAAQEDIGGGTPSIATNSSSYSFDPNAGKSSSYYSNTSTQGDTNIYITMNASGNLNYDLEELTKRFNEQLVNKKLAYR